VPALRPKNRFTRVFIVRAIVACRRCGEVRCYKFNNGLAGGGTHRCGYIDPSEIDDHGEAKDR
jgi:hypothetical protein